MGGQQEGDEYVSLFKDMRFLRFFTSRTSANIADSIYSVALLYCVQASTASVAFTSFTYTAVSTAAIFSFLVGPLVDRYKASLLASISLFVQAILIALVPWFIQDQGTNLIGILVVVFIASCFSMLFYPANSKMLPELLPSSELIVKANSIITSSDQIINIAGYLAGASLIIVLGMKNTFYLASGLLIFAGLVYLNLNREQQVQSESKAGKRERWNFKPYWSELKEGYNFVKNHTMLRIMLPFFAMTNFSMAILIIALPSIAVSYNSPMYYSLLYIVYFVGIFLGSFLTGLLRKNGLTISISWIFMGIAIFLFSILTGMLFKLIAILLLGLSAGVINVLQISFVQIITPLPLLGRVMAFVNTLSSAALPIGALIGGLLTLHFQLNEVFMISAVITLLCGILLLSIKAVRQFEIPADAHKGIVAMAATKESN
ncbi:enterobactin exporter EntS [compost metagenome]